MATIAIKTSNMPNCPIGTDCLVTDLKIDPFFQKISNKPIINKLNILLPKTSPAAKLTPSYPDMTVTAVNPVPNSGSEVAVANITTPTKERPKPVLIAITSADLVR